MNWEKANQNVNLELAPWGMGRILKQGEQSSEGRGKCLVLLEQTMWEERATARGWRPCKLGSGVSIARIDFWHSCIERVPNAWLCPYNQKNVLLFSLSDSSEPVPVVLVGVHASSLLSAFSAPLFTVSLFPPKSVLGWRIHYFSLWALAPVALKKAPLVARPCPVGPPSQLRIGIKCSNKQSE